MAHSSDRFLRTIEFVRNLDVLRILSEIHDWAMPSRIEDSIVIVCVDL